MSIIGTILLPVVLIGIAQRGYQADMVHAWTSVEIRNRPGILWYGNNNFQPALVDSPNVDSPVHLHMMIWGGGISGFVLFSWVFVRLEVELFPKK